MLVEDSEVAEKIFQNYKAYSFLRYIKSRLNLLSTIGTDTTIYFVHEIVGCKKKYELTRELLSQTQEEKEVNNAAFIIGDSVEKRVLELINAKESFVAFRYLDSDKKVLIVGNADGWYDNRPLEIKYRSSTCAPEEQHILQARLYAWLYDVDYSWLVIVSPKCIRSFRAYKTSEQELRYLLENWPSPRWPNECAFCPFALSCPLNKSATASLLSYVLGKDSS
jgi:CRISPR/Cas system-associated exonuclease Cas4 (RecB family)